jgi:hypothetical protein
MTKLRTSPDHFKAGLRASIVLLPIFGLQYTFYVVPIDPFDTCAVGTFVMRYIQIVIEALQGAIVSTIFCFLNGEVKLFFILQLCFEWPYGKSTDCIPL